MVKGEVPRTIFPSFPIVRMQPPCQNCEGAITFSSFRASNPTDTLPECREKQEFRTSPHTLASRPKVLGMGRHSLRPSVPTDWNVTFVAPSSPLLFVSYAKPRSPFDLTAVRQICATTETGETTLSPTVENVVGRICRMRLWTISKC